MRPHRIAIGFLPLFFAFFLRVGAQEPAAEPAGQAVAPNPAGQAVPAAAPPTADVPATPKRPPAEKIDLETSDGLRLKAWYYAVPEGESATGTVVLVHDLEGSHRSVEPLAVALQDFGFAVVTPDLRGHGASTNRVSAGRTDTVEARKLRRNDLELISQSTGGTVREQASIRGDLEAVRTWIKRKSDAGELDIQRLCIVGSGAGAILAANWAVADWAWRPIATGPQGRQVQAVVLVSPVWATKGISFTTALSSDVFKQEMPLMLLGGAEDRDAQRLFEQLRRQRPAEWFEQRPNRPPGKSPKLEKIADASLIFIELDSTLSADKLATDDAATTADRIKTFLSLVLGRTP